MTYLWHSTEAAIWKQYAGPFADNQAAADFLHAMPIEECQSGGMWMVSETQPGAKT